MLMQSLTLGSILQLEPSEQPVSYVWVLSLTARRTDESTGSYP